MADSDAPSTLSGPLPPQTLGQILRGARLAQELTVEQLSTELRIEAQHLNALEADRFDSIGIPVFVKGYLKQYGQRLGVDVRDLLALYYKQTTLADVLVQPSPSIKLRDERQITSWILALLVLLTLIVGLAVWWWNGGTFSGISAPNSTPPAVTTSAPTVEEPAAPPPQRIEQPTAAVPAAVQPAADAPGAAATAAGAPSTLTDATQAAANVEAVDEDDDERAAPAVAIPLEFSFDRESWAEVTDSRGQRLLFGLQTAGRQVTIRGEPPFAIVLGDATAVRLSVDGAPYAIPTAGRQGDLARFAVDIAEE
jgi:cytoskeleton protein RodZ